MEWLKPIGQLVDWSVSNTKPFIPWGTHTFHEWSSTPLHFISLVIKCLLTNFTPLLRTFYMMAIRSKSLHAFLSWDNGPLYLHLIFRHDYLFLRLCKIDLTNNKYVTLSQTKSFLVTCTSLWLRCYLCGAHTLYRCNSDVTPPLARYRGIWRVEPRIWGRSRGSLQGTVNRTGHSVQMW